MDNNAHMIDTETNRQAHEILKGRELFVFLALNGTPFQEKCSMDEVAKVFGLTRERIRQIFANAKKKMEKGLRLEGYM